jgi:hypothetical protein
VLTATAAIGSTVVAICYYYYYNQYRTSSSFAKKKGPHKGGGGTSRNQKETSSDAEEEVVLGGGSWDPSEFIPTHVARQIQKQARWQQKKELFAMKSPMYDNVQMLVRIVSNHSNEEEIIGIIIVDYSFCMHQERWN